MKTLSRTVLTLFVLSFSCLAAIAGEVSFKITKQYLNFPISHKENRGRMTFEVNGKPDLSVVIRLQMAMPTIPLRVRHLVSILIRAVTASLPHLLPMETAIPKKLR